MVAPGAAGVPRGLVVRMNGAWRINRQRAAARGFTLVELLIVVVVIAILLTAIVVSGGKLFGQQRVSVTTNTMRTVEVAIDQFRDVNPLRSVYDRRSTKSFGALPPYVLSNPANGSVNGILEPRATPHTFQTRVGSDLGGGQVNSVRVSGAPAEVAQRRHDDIRSLYVYLQHYVPDALANVPQTALKPLNDANREFFQFGAAAGAGVEARRTEILGILDGWGVPLDYVLYARLQCTPDGMVIAERIPALRSRGVSREEAENDWTGNLKRAEKWLWSKDLAQPLASNIAADGRVTGYLTSETCNTASDGWVRAVANAEDYGYLPAQDADN